MSNVIFQKLVSDFVMKNKALLSLYMIVIVFTWPAEAILLSRKYSDLVTSLCQRVDIKKLFKLLSVSKDLKQKVLNDINFLKDIRCFSGIRHKNRLPCRGQRTRTNSRTVRSRY